MHIEFQLPTGAAGMAAQHRAYHIRRQLKEWAMQHNIEYTTSLGKRWRMHLHFTKEQDYTLFTLSWQGEKNWELVHV